MGTLRLLTIGRRILVSLIVLAGCVTATPIRAADTSTLLLTGLPLMGQAWSLSCEYAATSAATEYYGAAVSQGTFLAAIGYDANPHKGFRGNINGTWGGTTDYGVYAEPIAMTLRRYGFLHSFVFYGNASTLSNEIMAHHPVVVWITGTWQLSSRITKMDAAGDRYALVPYEHAVTAYGYDNSGLWVMDPAYPDRYHVAWATFQRAWDQLDDMALVVAP